MWFGPGNESGGSSGSSTVNSVPFNSVSSTSSSLPKGSFIGSVGASGARPIPGSINTTTTGVGTATSTGMGVGTPTSPLGSSLAASRAGALQHRGPRESQEEIRNALNATHCYDIMRNSTKIVLFETTIPFQLAFYALVEHEAEVAPLYDPVYRTFIGLVSLRDYIHVINMYMAYKMPIAELPVRSIGDLLALAPNLSVFQHAEFNPVDAEDTVYQLCLQFIRSGADFIPVVDPDNGNIVAVLGLLDIIFLLSQISQEFPNLFAFSVSELGIGDFEGVLTASSSTLLVDVLRVMDSRGLSYMPVLDEHSGQLIGLYRKSNVAFITTAPDSDAVIANFAQIRIGDVVRAEYPTSVDTPGPPQSSPEVPVGSLGQQQVHMSMLAPPASVHSCSLRDALKTVIELMVTTRSCAVPFLNSEGKFCGILTARDILRYYCST